MPNQIPVSRLPTITDGGTFINGTFKQTPEDFVVEEVPAYLPSGEGSHTYVLIEKRGMTTHDAVKRICAEAGLDARQAGWAGLKDALAVSRQWLSFEKWSPEKAAALEIPDLHILEARQHTNKLRIGHLKGNRFTVVLRGVTSADAENKARTLITELERVGMPDYYGSQRFGNRDNTLFGAYAWLIENRHPPHDKFRRKLFASAFQSWIFNEVLVDRISSGLFSRALLGDIMRKEDTGGLFLVDNVEDAATRMDNWELSPTGPMVGVEMKQPGADCAALEAKTLARLGVSNESIEKMGRVGEGTRRVLRIAPTETEVSQNGDVLTLRFQLPKGAYATVLLRELLKNEGRADLAT